MAWVRLAPSSAVPDGANRTFEVGGQSILVARAPMGLFAVGAICSHQYTPLEGGKMKACFIFCPLHGVRFDLRDGTPTGTLTDEPLPTFPIKEEDGDFWLDLADA